MRTPRPCRYRRAAHVVSYWQDGRLVLHNYATGVRAAVAPLTIEILEQCGVWRSLRLLRQTIALPGDRFDAALETMLAVLVEATFLDRDDRPRPAAARAFDAWDGWNPAAGFFHASTKDVRYTTQADADARLRQKALSDPPPAMIEQVGSARRRAAIDLPPPLALGALTDTLRERRTWRRFGSGRIARGDLATLLHLTWGVQHWMQVDGFGRMPLKTSPSGGARHSIEAYALVRRVDGVRPGWYHYGPDDHRLHPIAAKIDAPLRRGSRGLRVSNYLPTQTWYNDAAVVVFMTAVFARAQWRYGYARAYRSILAEAGHLAQTFCLVATRLGLAPFCSMALADSAIERDLGIDGVSESVVYAAGAGRRPAGIAWAPWPQTDDTPARSDPTWKRRGRRA